MAGPAEDPAASGGTRRSGPGRRAARAAALALAAVGLVFAGGFGLFLGALETQEREPAAPVDAIVALTGGAQRIEDALDLLAKGYGRRLLITGVNERTSRERIKRLSPDQRELVECCVDLDYRARNTIGNAAEIRRWALDNGFRSLIVVTSNYHLPRTLAELDEALPEIRKVPYAVVTAPRPGEGFADHAARARVLLAEYVKYVAVSLRLMVVGAPPAGPEPGAAPGRRSVAEANPPR